MHNCVVQQCIGYGVAIRNGAGDLASIDDCMIHWNGNVGLYGPALSLIGDAGDTGGAVNSLIVEGGKITNNLIGQVKITAPFNNNNLKGGQNIQILGTEINQVPYTSVAVDTYGIWLNNCYKPMIDVYTESLRKGAIILTGSGATISSGVTAPLSKTKGALVNIISNYDGRYYPKSGATASNWGKVVHMDYAEGNEVHIRTVRAGAGETNFDDFNSGVSSWGDLPIVVCTENAENNTIYMHNWMADTVNSTYGETLPAENENLVIDNNGSNTVEYYKYSTDRKVERTEYSVQAGVMAVPIDTTITLKAPGVGGAGARNFYDLFNLQSEKIIISRMYAEITDSDTTNLDSGGGEFYYISLGTAGTDLVENPNPSGSAREDLFTNQQVLTGADVTDDLIETITDIDGGIKDYGRTDPTIVTNPGTYTVLISQGVTIPTTQIKLNVGAAQAYYTDYDLTADISIEGTFYIEYSIYE